MTIRDASGPAPKPPRRPAPQRRSVESDRTSDEGGGGRTRSSVERVPADDLEHDEIGPQTGYGGSGPDQAESGY